MESRVKIIWKYLSVLIIILLSIIVLIQGKQNSERVQYKERFVNHLYFQVDTCIDVIPEEFEKIEASQIERIINELNRLDTILYDGHSFLNSNIYYNYMINLRDIGNTIQRYYVEKHLKVDSKLSNLKKNLEDVKTKMSSDNTGQENPSLSIEDINIIFNDFFENYN